MSNVMVNGCVKTVVFMRESCDSLTSKLDIYCRNKTVLHYVHIFLLICSNDNV